MQHQAHHQNSWNTSDAEFQKHVRQIVTKHTRFWTGAPRTKVQNLQRIARRVSTHKIQPQPPPHLKPLHACPVSRIPRLRSLRAIRAPDHGPRAPGPGQRTANPDTRAWVPGPSPGPVCNPTQPNHSHLARPRIHKFNSLIYFRLFGIHVGVGGSKGLHNM